MNFTYIDIQNVSEYLEKIKEIKTRMNDNKDLFHPPIFFRGESQKFYNIQSSVYRDGYLNKDSYYEGNLINEALLTFPQMFCECQTNVDILVKMQHFSLPTRLIDITQNPLIALYFACENSCGKDGRVVFTQGDLSELDIIDELVVALQVSYKTSSIRSLVSSMLKKEKVLDISKSTFINKCRTLYSNISKTHFFKPAYWHDRIRAQQGLFIFTPIWKAHDEDEFKKIEDTLYDPKQNLQYDELLNKFMFDENFLGIKNDIFYKLAISIPSEKKKYILSELSYMGINEAFVYPDSEHQMRSIKMDVQRKIDREDFDIVDE